MRYIKCTGSDDFLRGNKGFNASRTTERAQYNNEMLNKLQTSVSPGRNILAKMNLEF